MSAPAPPRTPRSTTPPLPATLRRCATGLLLALLLGAAACPVSEYVADYHLEPAGPATAAGVEVGALESRTVETPNGARAVRTEGDEVALEWRLTSRGADLRVENRGDAPLALHWDGARLEGDFAAPLVLASPGSFEERDLPQRPTTLPPGGEETYSLILGPPGPWQPFTDDPDHGFWTLRRPLFDLDVDAASGSAARLETARRALGHELRLVLPIGVEGAEGEIAVPVRVADVRVRPTHY